MATSDVVAVSRVVAAPAAAIFALLADPRRHTELDGSEMLRGLETGDVLTSVGDVFVMRMYYEQFGDYRMFNTVVELEPDRLIAWEPVRRDAGDDGEIDDVWHHRWRYELTPDGPGSTLVTESFDLSRSPEDAHRILKGGSVWVDAMTALERIDRICTGGAPSDS